MNVSYIAVYGKKGFLVVLVLLVANVCVCLRFLIEALWQGLPYLTGVLLLLLPFLLGALLLLFVLLVMLVGKMSIRCHNGTITIQTPFPRTKEKKIILSNNDRIVLQCEGTGYDLSWSHVRMPVTPISYVIKTETGWEISRLCEKKAALMVFDYIRQSFPNIDARIDFSDEKTILKVRKLLCRTTWNRGILFASIMAGFISLLTFFASYCIYPTVFETNWEQCKIHVEGVQGRAVYVWVPDSKEQQRLPCSVPSDELPTLREAAKQKEELEAYIALGDSPELRLTAPQDVSDFVLFLSIACGMLFASIMLFYLFLRNRKKLRREFALAGQGNPLISE